jgi:hypothetical protein
MGLPEMAVGSLEEYEELAVDLAKNPARYADLRAAVGRNRLTHPLFDQDRYTRHLEQAVQLMWEQKVNNESGDIVVRSGNFFKAPDARLLSGSTRLQPSGERNEKSEESGT